MRAFRQVDVFCEQRCLGAPLAVVLDAEGLSTEAMQGFARWTNLSETTFVLPPENADADYRVRIFTPAEELPFAGHPTLGTCHAWLTANGYADRDRFVQECDAGLIEIRRTEEGLAFAAPKRSRSGPVDEPLLEHLAGVLGISRAEIVDAEWADNGPGWVGIRLADAEAVLALRPSDPGDHKIGVFGPHPQGSPEAFEVRTFFSVDGSLVEDPVTGSFNAALGQWLLSTDQAELPAVVRQGTLRGRAGRVHLRADADGTVWTGGAVQEIISGTVEL